ncbi:hypothetical protein JIN84_20135 [Luteolibacter yonseiensis]|uniref:Uncharacterized protein n=1 Tax=Luteolibacter yonseiensis TaxID=1144680 RepID=A0A934V948_9BACT|nr:hypothetical protein [Luteolibacter yonseiensis]MBK1817942.1 hypothetical protein [Luteolibacter yonseiensis]
MSHSENKLLHATMIPWVIALVAFVGLGALLPGQRAGKRQETSHDSGISALSDDVQLRGRPVEPVAYLEPSAADDIKASPVFSWIPRIEARFTRPTGDPVDGAVRGRAPPAWDIA